MKIKRVILDTNLWISFLISKDYSYLDDYIINKRVILIFSNELFNEFLEVINRPKFKKYFSKKETAYLVSQIERYAHMVEVVSDKMLCRDSKDNFLLNLSIDSKADYLITGDKDLLDLKKIESTLILTITDFKKELEIDSN